MNYFNHCIHYIPEENSEFHNYTNGFVPHLTIHMNLEKPDAEKKLEELKNIEPIEVTLIGEPIVDYVPEFSYLYYNVKTVNETPSWFPEGAHISFIYKNGDEITHEEIEALKNKITNKKCLLNNLKIMELEGDFFNNLFKKQQTIKNN